jgi:hypothetical protein
MADKQRRHRNPDRNRQESEREDYNRWQRNRFQETQDPRTHKREIGAEILATQGGKGRMTIGKNLSSTTTIEERA